MPQTRVHKESEYAAAIVTNMLTFWPWAMWLRSLKRLIKSEEVLDKDSGLTVDKYVVSMFLAESVGWLLAGEMDSLAAKSKYVGKA